MECEQNRAPVVNAFCVKLQENEESFVRGIRKVPCIAFFVRMWLNIVINQQLQFSEINFRTVYAPTPGYSYMVDSMRTKAPIATS